MIESLSCLHTMLHDNLIHAEAPARPAELAQVSADFARQRALSDSHKQRASWTFRATQDLLALALLMVLTALW